MFFMVLTLGFVPVQPSLSSLYFAQYNNTFAKLRCGMDHCKQQVHIDFGKAMCNRVVVAVSVTYQNQNALVALQRYGKYK